MDIDLSGILSNISANITVLPDYITKQNQVLYVEELCKPYIQNIAKAYIVVAIFNLFYSFIWLWLKNRKDKVLIGTTIENRYYSITVGDIAFMLDIMFFILNFFVFGYWLVLKYTSWFVNLPFIGWFS